LFTQNRTDEGFSILMHLNYIERLNYVCLFGIFSDKLYVLFWMVLTVYLPCRTQYYIASSDAFT